MYFTVNEIAGEREVRDLEEGKYYAEGNSMDLERFIGKLTDKKDVKVMFGLTLAPGSFKSLEFDSHNRERFWFVVMVF